MDELQKSKPEQIEVLISKGFRDLFASILDSAYKILILPINLVCLVLLVAVAILSIPALVQANRARRAKK